VFPVRYELGFIPQKTAFFILTTARTHLSEHYPAGLCSGTVCFLRGTNWAFIYQKTASFIVTAVKNLKSYVALIT
jgi:hypothetical protein